jgi:hypothetical protein
MTNALSEPTAVMAIIRKASSATFERIQRISIPMPPADFLKIQALERKVLTE